MSKRRRTPPYETSPASGEEREYSTYFDPWTLRCAASFLAGLIGFQERGGLRVRSFEVLPNEDTVAAVIEYYGNNERPNAVVGYTFLISHLRRMIGNTDDPAAAAFAYLHDMAVQPAIPGDKAPIDGIHWITFPHHS